MIVKYKPTEQRKLLPPAKIRLDVTADSDVWAVFLDYGKLDGVTTTAIATTRPVVWLSWGLFYLFYILFSFRLEN